MDRFRRLMVVSLVISLSFALLPAAQADTVSVRSQPNGDIRVDSSSGALSNRDKDADFNTLTQSDQGSLFYAVSNVSQGTQTVQVTVVLDGPGTAQDATLVDEDVVIGPNPDIHQASFEFKVMRKNWPAGRYSLSVTGSGTESATAVSTFTVNH